MTFGNVSVNITARSVLKNNIPVSLSLREFDLLAYLCEHPNTALPKERLLQEVWGAFSMVEASTLTVHIRWLREKLEDNPAEPRYIKIRPVLVPPPAKHLVHPYPRPAGRPHGAGHRLAAAA